MVSNYNTSRPPHWPPGALRASVGEVPTQPQTASGEAPPATRWLRPIYAGTQHYYPSLEMGNVTLCGETTITPTTRMMPRVYTDGVPKCAECRHLLGVMGMHVEASE